MIIKLHKAQTQIALSPARFKVVRAGRRTGKTYLACTVLIAKAFEVIGDYWFVAPYYRQAKEIAWQILFKLLPDNSIKNKNESELSVELRNGSSIKLKGADNQNSLKGVGLQGCVLDEYAFMKSFVWEEIVRPMLFDSGGWCIFISTPYGYNHFYDLWEQALKDNWERFHFTTYDNPYIKPEEIEDAKLTMSDMRFQQEIMAEFTKKSGAIYPMFNRGVHCKPKRNPVPESVIFGSIDFGFAIGHKTAVLWHEVTSEEVFTFDGFGVEQKTIEEINELMNAQTQGLTIRGIYPDPARPDLIEELRRRGWGILDTQKDVELGISKVAEYMQINPLTNKPRWTISEHLSDTIRQIEEYEWVEVRGEDGKYTQKPRKELDDFPDSLRYMLFNYTHEQPKQSARFYANKRLH